ncbi:hypothetical protein Q6249_28790, partial [Klebsiella pneumoniae]|uniref:hypothetical protein n=1 Tax=Klebsiella pneumoniae TaxID=573 RepID=UPI00272FBCBD
GWAAAIRIPPTVVQCALFWKSLGSRSMSIELYTASFVAGKTSWSESAGHIIHKQAHFVVKAAASRRGRVVPPVTLKVALASSLP